MQQLEQWVLSVLNQLEASKIGCGMRMCLRGENITKVDPRADHATAFAASVVMDERMWRKAGMWKYDALQISEKGPSIKYVTLQRGELGGLRKCDSL